MWPEGAEGVGNEPGKPRKETVATEVPGPIPQGDGPERKRRRGGGRSHGPHKRKRMRGGISRNRPAGPEDRPSGPSRELQSRRGRENRLPNDPAADRKAFGPDATLQGVKRRSPRGFAPEAAAGSPNRGGLRGSPLLPILRRRKRARPLSEPKREMQRGSLRCRSREEGKGFAPCPASKGFSRRARHAAGKAGFARPDRREGPEGRFAFPMDPPRDRSGFGRIAHREPPRP